jgi:hypothetical protein
MWSQFEKADPVSNVIDKKNLNSPNQKQIIAMSGLAFSVNLIRTSASKIREEGK